MVRPLYWGEDGSVMILDQRRLPQKIAYISCRDMGRVIRAIQTLAVRGAPAIGIAAAMGLALAARAIRAKRKEAFLRRLEERASVLKEARPTAVNLAWAVDKMLDLARSGPEDVVTLVIMLERESRLMLEEDIAVNRAIGRHGAKLVPGAATILTHCNAGALATGGYGTALGVVRAAKEAGKEVSVIADETRPLLQGARLTAWEMLEEGIPVDVAVDGAVGVIMDLGLVDLVLVGADRIAMNGDTANKVGTFNVALQAKRHNVPFYVAAPLSTVDPECETGRDIPIERREPLEVTSLAGRAVAAPGAGAINFAFDVTPNDLVTGIITEAGVLHPPFNESLAKAKAGLKI